jgi:hypothetical protein
MHRSTNIIFVVDTYIHHHHFSTLLYSLLLYSTLFYSTLTITLDGDGDHFAPVHDEEGTLLESTYYGRGLAARYGDL